MFFFTITDNYFPIVLCIKKIFKVKYSANEKLFNPDNTETNRKLSMEL